MVATDGSPPDPGRAGEVGMTTCGCGQAAQRGDEWCSGCGRHLDGGGRRQPETVTVVQVLLVLSAVGAALGLLVAAYVVSAALSFLSQLGGLGGAYGGAYGLGGDATGGLGGTSGAITGALGLAVLETIVVIGVSVWAFRAVGAGRSVARPVLAALAGVEAVLTTVTLASLETSASVVAGAVLAGLLVLDAPVLVLLWAPAASRAWFTGAPIAPATPAAPITGTPAAPATSAAPAAPAAPATPAAPAAPAAPATPAAPAAPPAPVRDWAPPLLAPRSAGSGPLPPVPSTSTPPDEDAATVGIILPSPASLPVPIQPGRHSARELQA